MKLHILGEVKYYYYFFVVAKRAVYLSKTQNWRTLRNILRGRVYQRPPLLETLGIGRFPDDVRGTMESVNHEFAFYERNKAAAGCRRRPSRCNFTNRQNPSIQQNCYNFLTNNEILMCFRNYNVLTYYDLEHPLQPFGRGGTLQIFSQRISHLVT